MISKIFCSLFVVCLSFFAYAQSFPSDQIQEWGVEKHKSHLRAFLAKELKSSFPDDVEIAISSTTKSALRGYRHVYLQQLVQGYPLLDAVGSIHYDAGGRVFWGSAHFLSLSDRSVRPHNSLNNIFKTLEAFTGQKPVLLHRKSYTKGIFYCQLGHETFAIQQVYRENKENEIQPVFTCMLSEGNQLYRYWFDGENLELLEKSPAGHQCTFHQAENPFAAPLLPFASYTSDNSTTDYLHSTSPRGNTQGLYRAIPYPFENPLQSEVKIIEEPLNPFSPYGWHDGNGEIGQQFDISRGNNVHAFADRQNTGMPQGTEPQNEDRNFTEIVYDWNLEPENLVDFHTLQTFYSVNYLHDLTSSLGFDEESGNFQLFNYSDLGTEGDEVRARVQLDAQNKNILNTAFFATDIDGIKGQMAVSLFQTGRSAFLTTELPNFGTYTANITLPTFGPPLEGTLTSKLVIGKTGEDLEGTYLGCKTLTNSQEIQGAIALIDRGDCQFRDKVRRAEDAGAIAVLICNFEDALINMGGGGTLGPPTIPSAMASSSACKEFKMRLHQGEEIILSLVKPDYQGPAYLDGSLDNGVIAHEYMHGVTDRLVGGRMNAFCLLNAESMTEGWSDFFSLATTVKEEDQPQNPRSIAAFLSQQDLSGQGIRRFPYTSDPISLNSIGYKDITGAGTIHQIGEIWASVLWDVFWVFLNKYGIESSYTQEESGNFKGLLLIIEALKLTPCNPGFTDARDALLLADNLLFEGEHQCDLWAVFARRGLGVLAQQGLSSDKDDGLADFTLPKSCFFPLSLEKSMPDLIGFEAENKVTFHILNNGNKLEGALLIDSLPPGYSIINLNPNLPFEVSNDLLSLQLPTLDRSEALTIEYTLVPGQDSPTSQRLKFDPAESFHSNWEIKNVTGDYPWAIDSADPYEGNSSWTVYYSFGSSIQDLYWKPNLPEATTLPILSFFQKFNTPAGISGGYLSLEQQGDIVEITEKNLLKGKYPRRMNPRVFSRNFIDAYSGEQSDYQRVLVDLRSFDLESLGIRWRYGALNTTSFLPLPAWSIDNIEILEAIYYDLGCKILNNQQEIILELYKSSNGGSLVDTLLPTKLLAKEPNSEDFLIFPNPASQEVNLHFAGAKKEHQSIEIRDFQGRPVGNQSLPFPTEFFRLSLGHLPPGIYILNYFNGYSISTRKLILK